jgi:hypothetical protein
MAGGAATPLQPIGPPPAAGPDQFDSYIQGRLRQTRRHVKAVDIAAGLLSLAAGTLGYLLAAAVIDHWIVTGGLGAGSRFLLLFGLLGAGGWYFSRRLLRPLLYRISEIFAADTIEKSGPALKNSLINFLLLRGHRGEVSPVVYEALEQRAAADLGQVRSETAVDRGHVIRLGYLLAGILAVFCLYVVLSPKSPLSSAARVLLPWARIPAPTRVTIEEVKPGDAVAFHGESVTVSAEVTGLKQDESVVLYYSTADSQSVDQAIPMTRSEDQFHYNRYTATVPPGSLGLQQDYEYYLAAGDCTTARFKIEVRIAPTIRVESVDYHYPPYTGIADRSVPRQGDIRAIEGTEVTLRAKAKQDIRRAEIDLNCDGRRGLTMDASGRVATGRFTLRLGKDDPTQPEYDCYQLRFTDRGGNQNRRPVRYRIEVIPDLPPEIQMVEPQQAELRLAEDGRLEIRLRAEDPDFALRQVALHAEHSGKGLPIRPLLSKSAPEKPHQGEFQGVYAFEPARLGLKAGQRVAYWAEAVDNKEPVANRSVTEKRWIDIVGPESPQPQPPGETAGAKPQRPRDQQGQQGQSGQHPDGQPKQEQQPLPEQPQGPAKNQSPAESQRANPNESQEQGPYEQNQQPQGAQDQVAQAGDSSGKGQPANAGGQGQPSDKSAQQRREPIDPANEGEAIEEINKHRQEQQEPKTGQPKAAEQPSGGQPKTGEQQSGGQPKAGEQPSGGQPKTGEQPSGGQPKAGEQPSGGQPKAGEQPSGGQPKTGEQPSAGQPKTGEQPSGGQPKAGEQPSGGQPKTGEQPSGGQPKAGEQPSGGQPKAGEQPSGGQPKTGEQPSGGQPKTGEQPSGGQPKTGEQPSGGQPKAGEQPSGGQPKAGGKELGSEPKPVERRASPEKKSGEQQPAEQKPGTAQQQGQQEPPGAGKKSSDSTASPAPQGANQPRQKKPGDASQSQQAKQEKPDSPQSPSTSRKQSDSQGDTAGDRSGGGEQGGGQRSNQSGVGSAGTHTDAETGGSQSNQQGAGETGRRAGEQVASSQKTGSSATQEHRDGDGSGTARQQPGGEGPGKKPANQDSPGAQTAQQQPADGGQPGSKGSDQPGARGQGSPTSGGQPGEASESQPQQQPPGEPGGDEANLEYARMQTNLALEHLKDQLAKEKPELLDRLGWTPEEARRFLERWGQMERAAAEQGPRAEAAKKQLDEALRSLGLRPRGTQLQGGQTPRDQLQNLRDAGRFAPPPEWAEQVRQYHRGVAGSKQ